MRKIVNLALVFCAMIGLSEAKAASKNPTDYVNIFIGSDGVGHSYPGATTPFGMVQLSPDTRYDDWSACSGYQYVDETLYGFSHTHLSGTGGADLADILILPITERIEKDAARKKLEMGMVKATEYATPGYYTVTLANGVKAELSATPRCGAHRYTYPKGVSQMLLLDLTHVMKDSEKVDAASIEKISDTEIRGMRITSGWSINNPIYFVARFSQPIKEVSILNDKNSKAVIEFATTSKPVEVMVGISATGFDGAMKNLNAETAKKKFDKIRKEAHAQWNKELGKIVVKGGSEDQTVIFYTSLYHSMICPNTFNDVDGQYLGMDGKVHSAKYTHYHTFSLWDTFRAVHPLFNLIAPERSRDMMQSLVDKQLALGFIPKWELWANDTDCMIGNHGISVIAEAIVMDLGGFDYRQAYEACKKTLENGHDQLPIYEKYGYIPSNQVGRKSVSKTLEFAYNDWCMAAMAEKLGYTEDYEYYKKRAYNYENLFDAKRGFFVGRMSDGTFDKSFNPQSMGENFTEATGWQYLHFVPQDPVGLANLFGGRDGLAKSLDALFNADTMIMGKALPDITGRTGQYAHGNEPSHGTIFLYNYSSEPWRTSYFTRTVLSTFYQNKNNGLCGNDDCGQMSAWYVFSSMGMYPTSPINNEYQLTAPIFTETEIKLEGGRKFLVKTVGDIKHHYINRITLNGKEIDRNYLTYKEVMNGGELVFELSKNPNMTRAMSDASMPKSISKLKTATPFMAAPQRFFTASQPVELICRTGGSTIRYTLDGSAPSATNGMVYDKPFVINGTTTIRAIANAAAGVSDELNIKVIRETPLPGKPAIANLEKGYSFAYYEGNIKHCADMLKATPKKTGTMSRMSISSMKDDRKDNWGVIFKGWMNIEVEDVYEFYGSSDDGMVVYVDGVEVLNNDGSHSQARAAGVIMLGKGLHEFEVRYMQDTGYATLQLGVQGGGVDSGTSLVERMFIRN